MGRVDACMTGLGFRMGPFETQDRIGLHTVDLVAQYTLPSLGYDASALASSKALLVSMVVAAHVRS